VERHNVISWLSVCLLSAGILSDVVYISYTYIAVGLKALYSDNITLLYIVYTDSVFCLGFKLVTFPGDCSLNTMINFLRNGGLDVFQCIGGHKLDNMVQSTATFCRAEGDRCAVYCVSQPTHTHTQYAPTWRVGLFVRSSWSRNVKKQQLRRPSPKSYLITSFPAQPSSSPRVVLVGEAFPTSRVGIPTWGAFPLNSPTRSSETKSTTGVHRIIDEPATL